MSFKSFLPAALLLLMPCVSELSAQVYTNTFACTADTYTSSAAPSTNYGAVPPNATNNTLNIKAIVSPMASTDVRRGYFNFDLANATLPAGIPSNARIISAKLTLTIVNETGTSPTFYMERIPAAWNENTLTHTSANALGQYVSVSMNGSPAPVHNKRQFILTTEVQAIVSGLVVNRGWMLHHANETTANSADCSYYTREDATAANRPVLEVQWYVPMSVGTASVTNASGASTADGGVYPQLINGASILTGSRTYSWFNGNGSSVGTSPSLPTVVPGWYGLRVIDSLPDTLYIGFVVGLQCGSFSFDFKPGKNYISETVISNQYTTNTQVSVANTNYANTLAFQATRWQVASNDPYYNIKGLMRFHLWVDPSLTLDTARLYLYSRGHSVTGSRLNTSNLVKIITPWKEREATYNRAPATSTAVSVTIPSTTTTLPVTTDIRPFWNDWKSNNAGNYGFMMRLADTVTPSKANMNFHTTNVATEAQWPYIRFRVTSNDCVTYSKLQPELDGAYHHTINNSLYFQYTEEYQEADGILKYRVTNLATGALVTGLSNITGVKYGDNRLKLPAASLANGFYVLEVENQKGEIMKLRFKKI